MRHFVNQPRALFTFAEWKFVFSSVIKYEGISFKTVKVSFIYENVCFIILSTRYYRLPTGYQQVTNALPYALLYYNRQLLQYSIHDHFLCNIRCTTVHATMQVHNCTIFNGFPRVTVNFIIKGNSILLF